MDIIPPAKVAKIEELEPGDLFLYIYRTQKFYAIKTKKPQDRDRGEMVILGPTFDQQIHESFLTPWQPITALSFGKSYSILLPTDPACWLPTGPSRTPVCLAIVGEKAYICTNGRVPFHDYFPCFVDLKTGEIVEGSLPSPAMFTSSWEIALLTPNHPSRSILRYPVQ